jgi:3-hydroxyacyl-CoA dehydrogenase
MRRYVQAGRLGRKSGRGVYEYDAEGRRTTGEGAE